VLQASQVLFEVTAAGGFVVLFHVCLFNK